MVLGWRSLCRGCGEGGGRGGDDLWECRTMRGLGSWLVLSMQFVVVRRLSVNILDMLMTLSNRRHTGRAVVPDVYNIIPPLVPFESSKSTFSEEVVLS